MASSLPFYQQLVPAGPRHVTSPPETGAVLKESKEGLQGG